MCFLWHRVEVRRFASITGLWHSFLFDVNVKNNYFVGSTMRLKIGVSLDSSGNYSYHDIDCEMGDRLVMYLAYNFYVGLPKHTHWKLSSALYSFNQVKVSKFAKNTEPENIHLFKTVVSVVLI